MKTLGSEFELRQVRRLELVCRDIARTSAFYRDALGMRLVNTFDLPREARQRVVFDVGDGALLVFLCFQRATEPGASCSAPKPVESSLITAYGAVRQVTFDVSVERFSRYAKRLQEKGVPTSLGVHRDERPNGEGKARTQSLYCLDPDGIFIEFACQPGLPVETLLQKARDSQESRTEAWAARRPTVLEPA